MKKKKQSQKTAEHGCAIEQKRLNQKKRDKSGMSKLNNNDGWVCYKTNKPGDKGQAKITEKYGNKLVAIRYWKNDDGATRKTVELIEEESK